MYVDSRRFFISIIGISLAIFITMILKKITSSIWLAGFIGGVLMSITNYFIYLPKEKRSSVRLITYMLFSGLVFAVIMYISNRLFSMD